MVKMTGQTFLDQQHKAITVTGMSGVGKTTLAGRLADWGWYNYSCDYRIGTDYLGEEMVRTLSEQEGRSLTNEITPGNLRMLSQFVGQLGGAAQGGLDLAEFKRRQKLYYDAECKAVSEVATVMADAKQDGFTHFINDSTGSLCEIEDEDLLAQMAAQTLLVYIKASPAENEAVLERARDYPKPLFFPPSRFGEWLDTYSEESGAGTVEEIVPDDFSRWVFPHLFESRLPKYQRLADLYGVTLSSDDLASAQSEEQFMDVVAGALDT